MKKKKFFHIFNERRPHHTIWKLQQQKTLIITIQSHKEQKFHCGALQIWDSPLMWTQISPAHKGKQGGCFIQWQSNKDRVLAISFYCRCITLHPNCRLKMFNLMTYIPPGAGFCGQNLWIKYIPCVRCRYPFMNNNGCQICFILLPNLEIINIQKVVTHIAHCLSCVYYLYLCYTSAQGSFKAPGQPGARPVTPTFGIWLRALTLRV